MKTAYQHQPHVLQLAAFFIGPPIYFLQRKFNYSRPNVLLHKLAADFF